MTVPELRTAVAVVVPCYNAGPRLPEVIKAVSALAEHVIVVDDGSTDGAVATLGEMPVRVIRFPKNRGKGAAMIAGFRAALEIPEVLCAAIVDADGQHDPAEIPALYDAFVQQSADLVIGSRTFEQRHVPWASWLGNTLTRALTARLLKRRLPDTQSGFRLHSRRLLEDIIRNVPDGRYETEMEIVVLAVRGGYTVVSVPIQTIYEAGNPTSHFRKIRDSWRVWRALIRAAARYGIQRHDRTE